MASLWRAGLWFLNGWWSYGRAGYEKRARDFIPADLEVDLAGKIAIVTGKKKSC